MDFFFERKILSKEKIMCIGFIICSSMFVLLSSYTQKKKYWNRKNLKKKKNSVHSFTMLLWMKAFVIMLQGYIIEGSLGRSKKKSSDKFLNLVAEIEFF